MFKLICLLFVIELMAVKLFAFRISMVLKKKIILLLKTFFFIADILL